MSTPARYLIRMLIFLAVVGVGLFLIRDQVVRAFGANPWLNGLIVAVLILGVAYTFRQALMLWPEALWVRAFQRDQQAPERNPRLLAPMATMIGERTGQLRLSTTAMRTLLDGIGARLDEGRELSRYLIGLLVFLGLLGTFWGLIETIWAVAEVINALSVGTGEEFAQVFKRFKEGLVKPLSGAGTAFSTSLFGLAGSLIVGFLDLSAGQAQSRFYTHLEDWLSGMTRLTSLANIDGDSPESMPAYLQALLEHTAEQMEQMNDTLRRGTSERDDTTRNLGDLTARLGTLTEQMRTEQNLMARLAEAQVEMKPILERLANEQSFGRQEMVTQLRGELQAMANRLAEIQMEQRPMLQQMAEDGTAGRRELIQQLSVEFQGLTAQLVEAQSGSQPALQAIAEADAASRAELINELRNEFRILARTLASMTETPPERRRTVKLDPSSS